MELNQITVYGNLANDPDGRRTNSGQSVCTFRIAINRKSREGEKAVFIDVTAWNKTADFCRDYLKRGAPVVVIGRLDMDSWDDNKTGAKRSKHFITANSVQSVRQERQEPTGSSFNPPGGMKAPAPSFPKPDNAAPPPFPGANNDPTESPQPELPSAPETDQGYDGESVDDVPF